MSSPTGRLGPGGPVVRASPHHLGVFDLSARVRIVPGSEVGPTGVRPVGPARPAMPEELAQLDAQSPTAGGRPALEVFTTPALLREHFEALDPDELPGPGETTSSPRWASFAADVRDFLQHIRLPVAAVSALLLTVRDPDHPPALFAPGVGRTLLHRDSGSGPASARDQAAGVAHLNLGATPSHLTVFSVPLAGMAALLARESTDVAPSDALALVTHFAQRFPGCPLVALTLEPGDGVFVPLGALAYDFDASGATDLDITLSVVPGPAAR